MILSKHWACGITTVFWGPVCGSPLLHSFLPRLDLLTHKLLHGRTMCSCCLASAHQTARCILALSESAFVQERATDLSDTSVVSNSSPK